VSCVVENGEKEGMTVTAGVDATGRKISLTIIGKGKMPSCLSAFNLLPEIWTATSPFGLTTADVICRYFQLLRECLYLIGPLIPLIDTHAAHWAAVTKAVAEPWGTELVFIPPGCTDLHRPAPTPRQADLRGFENTCP
jgi:hypothetical protein